MGVSGVYHHRRHCEPSGVLLGMDARIAYLLPWIPTRVYRPHLQIQAGFEGAITSDGCRHLCGGDRGGTQQSLVDAAGLSALDPDQPWEIRNGNVRAHVDSREDYWAETQVGGSNTGWMGFRGVPQHPYAVRQPSGFALALVPSVSPQPEVCQWTAAFGCP